MHLTRKIGVDLGTTNSRVWVEGKGVVLDEPTIVVVSLQDKRVVAVGSRAKAMLGRAPSNILASQPMRNGVIADYVITEAMLRSFLQGVMGKSFLFKPEVMVSVPAGSTQVERHAVMDATVSAGARSVYLIDNPLAAIVGAGLPVEEPSGNMVLDVGGGVAEAAVVSLGGVVASRSVRVGGNTFDDAIIKHVRRKHGVVIGEQKAEQVKREIGSAVPIGTAPMSLAASGGSATSSRAGSSRTNGIEKTFELKGRDHAQGLPRQVILTSSEVREALQKPLFQIADMVKHVLETVPPELASDIIDKGIVMTGGSAQLSGFDAFLTKELGVPTTVVDEPELCVIKGISLVFERFDVFKHALHIQS